MKIEISDNTFKYILNQVIKSKKFQDELSKNIREYSEKAFRDLTKRAYDRGFNDGIKKEKSDNFIHELFEDTQSD